ncbi:hypothetical protein CCYA_CCYA17G4310 [Cyanidiococcus yangmingshanensis]|nr:hypothetical protein CCYA_CCYA17G4310 [Cyanidiococcus yangmingshanensis]
MRSLISWCQGSLRSLYPGLRVLGFSAPRLLGLFPVVAVCFIVSLGYISVVIVTLLPMLATRPLLAKAGLVIIHGILALMIWSYTAVVLVDPGSVPPSWSFACLGWPLELRGSPEARRLLEQMDGAGLYDSSEQGMLAQRPRFLPNDKIKLPATVLMRNSFGRYRFCSKCLTYKPDRTHHCSALGRCVLKMDHYCPWTNNTIGFYNHKFFVQFLYYAFLASLITAMISLPAILHRLVEETTNEQTREFVIVILGLLGWIICLVFSFTLLFFAGFHTYLVLRNKTTIETYEVTDPAAAVILEAFDLGASANWKSVFGENLWGWLLPIWYGHRRGNGVHWETNARHRVFV